MIFIVKNYDICVIFGGVSGENEISVITGTMCCNVLKAGGMKVLPVYLAQDGGYYVGEGLCSVAEFREERYKKSDECAFKRGGLLIMRRGRLKYEAACACVINCCHGGWAEGGAVSGLMQAMGLPLASAGVFESAALLDKRLTKLVLSALNVSIAPYIYLNKLQGATDAAKEMGYPLIVKPATLGSSIGVARVEDEKQLLCALQTAFELDSGVVLEHYYSPRREINCAAYMAQGRVVCSPLEEAQSSGGVLSYGDKYSGGGKRIFPAELPEDVARHIKAQTESIYRSLNMRGIVRFDYIITSEDKLDAEHIILSEINTVPGSLSQYLLSKNYRDFFGVLSAVIEQAKADFFKERTKRIIYTGILNDLPPPSAKIK